MRCTPFLTCLLFAWACAGEDTAVTLTADGEFHQSLPLMRKHANHKEDGANIDIEERGLDDPRDDHELHNPDETKGMFGSMDLNQDGLVTADEVKASILKVGSPAPKDMLKMLSDLDIDGDGGISYAEFLVAAEDASKKRVHAHRYPVAHQIHMPEHAAVTRGASELERADEVQLPDDDELAEEIIAKSKTTKEDAEESDVKKQKTDQVSCGGHIAVNCEACPMTDDDGKNIFDHGEEWCNGDCVYHMGECHTIGTFITNKTNVKVDDKGNTDVKEKESLGLSTSPIPNLLNPDITPEDREISKKAAKEAVHEEELEMELKEEEEREGVHGEEFSWRKFWYIVIICASAVLGLCALISMVAVVVFCFMPKPDGLLSTKEELLDDEADSVEGESYDGGEGEEVDY